MGFVSAILAMLAGGYVLGTWTALKVLRDRQDVYEDGGIEQRPFLPTVQLAVVRLETSR